MRYKTLNTLEQNTLLFACISLLIATILLNQLIGSSVFAWVDIIINVIFLVWWLTKYIIKDYFYKIINKIKEKEKEKDIRGLIFLLKF